MNRVRRAISKDIDRIMKLLIQVNNVHHKGRPDLFKKDQTKYRVNELEKILNDKSKVVFVSVNEEDQVEGYVFCDLKEVKNDNNLVDHKSIYIDDLCVDELVRGKHIGKHLYEYVKDYAKKEGFYNITLNVWTCNPSALEFYKKNGLIPQKIVMEEIL